MKGAKGNWRMSLRIFQGKAVLAGLLGLILISFFGSLVISAALFPQHYDWRYRVISNLLSPRDNPHHYWLPSIGVAISGLCLVPFAYYLQQKLGVVSKRNAQIAGAGFLIGGIGLVCASLVVPQHVHAVFGVRRPHELLARIAAGFMAVGMLAGCWCAWRKRGRMISRPLAWTWLVVTVLPLTGLLISESLLLLSQYHLAWATAMRRMFRGTVFWHLGFWEWSGAVAVYLFLCAAVFFMSPES
jgi:hypothetical protein